MNKLISIAAFILLSGPTWAAESLSLPDLLLQARERNPRLKAAYQAWKVAEAEVSPAGAWPSPTFTYIDEKDPSGMDGVDPLKRRHYNVQQMVPFPGKLSLESRMKHHEALITKTRYQTLLLELSRDVRQRYYQLYLTDRATELADQSVAIMKSVLRSAQARLASGQASASDVFMAQTELRKMETMAFEQRQQRTLIQLELNTLLFRPIETPLGATTPPQVKDVPATLADLQTLADRNNPEKMAGRHETDHSQAMIRRNRMTFAPDFGLMYEYQTAGNAGPAGRQIGVSVSWPLWLNKPWGELKAAQEHRQETEAIAADMDAMVKKMVHMQWIETNTHLTMVRTYRSGILPSAQGNLSIVRQQYASGKTDFMRFLEAFRSWTGANLDYQNELYRYGEAWSNLERWVGVDLEYTRQALEQNEWMPRENHNGK